MSGCLSCVILVGPGQELEQETVLPGRRPSGMRAARSFSQGKMQAAGQGVVADTAGEGFLPPLCGWALNTMPLVLAAWDDCDS